MLVRPPVLDRAPLRSARVWPLEDQWRMSADAADLAVEAAQLPRHGPVGLGCLQRPQAVGADLDHLVMVPPAGLLNPGDPGPPGAVALVPLPGEQVPHHAGGHLHQRRRPRGMPRRHHISMRNYVRLHPDIHAFASRSLPSRSPRASLLTFGLAGASAW